MDTGLLNEQGIDLTPGEVLRLRDAAGRHIGVVRGIAWVTQDGDFQDRVLGIGESFRFDRQGLALVLPLGVGTRLVLEEGLVPERKPHPGYLSAGTEELAYFERRARRMRAETVAQGFAGAARVLKALWNRIAALASAGRRTRRTADELRALSDYFLKDIGLRRDQIDCVSRRVPC